MISGSLKKSGRKFKKFSNQIEMKTQFTQSLWDTAEEVIRRSPIAMSAYIKK
jgi:hypothetical protein